MRKSVGVIIIVCLLVALSLPVAAGISEYTDQGYNFTKVRTVLITEPTFIYGEVNGRDQFEKYPDSARVITGILNNRLKKAMNLRYVTWDYVADRVKADPDLECDPASPEFAALVKREMPKYVDLVLNLNIVNFGWLRQYHEAYEAYETVTDRVKYKRKLPDGREESGWMDVERTVLVHHPAHYEVIDSAEAQLYLLDPRTGKNVWTYGERRTRTSPGGSGGYDRSGPESVMNRIFIEAVEHMPIYPKPDRGPTYQ
jgi:hypothetical protein